MVVVLFLMYLYVVCWNFTRRKIYTRIRDNTTNSLCVVRAEHGFQVEHVKKWSSATLQRVPTTRMNRAGRGAKVSVCGPRHRSLVRSATRSQFWLSTETWTVSSFSGIGSCKCRILLPRSSKRRGGQSRTNAAGRGWAGRRRPAAPRFPSPQCLCRDTCTCYCH